MYNIVFHQDARAQDLKQLDFEAQTRVVKVIRKKLAVAPEQYGKPLARELKGLWKLKIGPYRVVYEIHQKEIMVYVIAIGARRDNEVYVQAAKRMGIL